MITLRDNAGMQLFKADAMNTTFSFRILDAEPKVAEEAVSACINQLEELESELSRFRSDSDVSRINTMPAGESLYISDRVHACLLKAAEAQEITAGLFDVTTGAFTWGDRASPVGEIADADGQLEVAPDQPLVRCHAPGKQVDLGGIGKGFALDQLARTLLTYNLGSCLLSAGASTLLALGPDSWPVELSGLEIELKNRALSASGTGIQGAHVVHPDEPEGEARYHFERVWVFTSLASLADAISTACLLMNPAEMKAFVEVQADLVEVYVQEAGKKLPRRI